MTESLTSQLLNLPLNPDENDARAETVREYFVALLSTLWREEDGFSGKRPLGNSDWKSCIYIAMSKVGLCDLELDEDGYIDSFSSKAEMAADDLILKAIDLMGRR